MNPQEIHELYEQAQRLNPRRAMVMPARQVIELIEALWYVKGERACAPKHDLIEKCWPKPRT